MFLRFFLGSEAGDGAPTKGGVGAWEERGAGQEERGGAGRDFPTQGQKEESRAGAGGCGETALTFKNVYLEARKHGHTLISIVPGLAGQQAQADLRPSP